MASLPKKSKPRSTASSASRNGSFEMFAATPSGRRIWVIWRYDREDEGIPDVFGELGQLPIFVITAYW